jgi:hypothetical protein
LRPISPLPEGRMIDEIMEDRYEQEHGHQSPIPFGFDGRIPCSPPRPALRVLPTATSNAVHDGSPLSPSPHPVPPSSRQPRP